MNLTQRFSDLVLRVQASDLTKRDLEQVRRLLLDAVGVAYAGAATPWIAAMHKWAEPYRSAGRSGVIAGSFRAPATIAALINGTAAHSLELDDAHDESLSHPGAVVIPAALAVGCEQRSTGAEFAVAIIAGYEAMTSLGVAVDAAQLIRGGFHPTAVLGVFGAATAASVLYGLDRSQHLHAWGHALSLAGGAMQFCDEASATTVKRLHSGFPAHNGILAAQLARAGIDAPERALDGKYGFLHLFGRDSQPELLIKKEDDFAIHQISLKPYACCRQFHSAIDAIQAVTTDLESDIHDIEAIIVRGPQMLWEQHMLRRPLSPMAAQYSLPYVIGATLQFGPFSLIPYEDKSLSDSGILRWADMVRFEEDAEFEALFPARLGSEIEIKIGGHLRRSRVLDSMGTAANPLSWDAVLEKVGRLTTEMHPKLDLAALGRTILALPDGDIASLDTILMG